MAFSLSRFTFPGHTGIDHVIFGLIVFGGGAVLYGLSGVFTRRIRGRDAPLGLGYRTEERMSPFVLRIGLVVFLAGLLGEVIRWVIGPSL